MSAISTEAVGTVLIKAAAGSTNGAQTQGKGAGGNQAEASGTNGASSDVTSTAEDGTAGTDEASAGDTAHGGTGRRGPQNHVHLDTHPTEGE
ncbi:hypothetical protein IAT40_007529 [Kwoniella sp. CBS 6097]